MVSALHKMYYQSLGVLCNTKRVPTCTIRQYRVRMDCNYHWNKATYCCGHQYCSYKSDLSRSVIIGGILEMEMTLKAIVQVLR